MMPSDGKSSTRRDDRANVLPLIETASSFLQQECLNDVTTKEKMVNRIVGIKVSCAGT